MSEKIVVCLEKGGARDMAEAFSRRTNTPISEKPGEHLAQGNRCHSRYGRGWISSGSPGV